jgi:hypothetical protein
VAAGPSRPLLDEFPSALEIPALRDRLDDLPALLAALTTRETGDGPTVRWMPDAIQALRRLPWPGNVASLEALALERVIGSEAASGIVGRRDGRGVDGVLLPAAGEADVGRSAARGRGGDEVAGVDDQPLRGAHGPAATMPRSNSRPAGGSGLAEEPPPFAQELMEASRHPMRSLASRAKSVRGIPHRRHQRPGAVLVRGRSR